MKDESETKEEKKSEVPIPEEFQMKVMELLEECSSKEELSFIRDSINRKEDEVRKEEMSKNKVKNPSVYSASDMPCCD